MGSFMKMKMPDQTKPPDIQGPDNPEQGTFMPVCSSPQLQTGLKDQTLLQNCHPTQEKLDEKVSNMESSSLREQKLSGSEKTTSNSGLSVLLIAPILAFAATQNKQSLLFEENKKDKQS